ncbi:S-adenosyl-L-methionine-dependent methyltransferase [Blyttiomyces helicus]|uniref:S-adenosyl-L-methionine-dependent methyltransferase n=1 Tax=Blyttiomyces helicus TaxID=388810 RepID=A0A4P9WJC9_9FUNG|nr:S-adenosyl-L-methionine-dependent methyltransferase [Blyttiomyces helicus]|eukprot:RKO92155.1 S-adenosyl-L-methionine-dependent methyltransferase [Blyttiomyces helicus]
MSFYKKAGEILKKLELRKGTIKSLILAEDVPATDKKRMLALVCESLKYKEVIEDIVRNAQVSIKQVPPSVLVVLVYDLLFGRGIGAGGTFKPLVMKHKTRLQAELAKIKIKRKVKDNTNLIPEHIRNAVVLPRYVRVNTLKASVDNVIAEFVKNGFALEKAKPSSGLLRSNTLCQDEHIPEILLLPSNIDLHDNKLLENGSIIIQDKASCFPAFVLNPPKGCEVIDACAAPGNKTSHLSAIMQNTGKIRAFDMDKRRLQTLIKLSGRAGCKNIEPILGSFLDADPTDPQFKNVEYILLDPSCSGSGIVGRMDHLLVTTADLESEEVEEADSARVASLAEFQKTVLLHAFRFPAVKRVVYSTCSKHREENEDVVAAVLAAQSDFGLASEVFPTWERRGLQIVEGGKLHLTSLFILFYLARIIVHAFYFLLSAHNLIRTDPSQDHVIGFFVALFERKPARLAAAAPAGTKRKPDSQLETEVAPLKKKKKGKKTKKKKKSAASLQDQEHGALEIDDGGSGDSGDDAE